MHSYSIEFKIIQSFECNWNSVQGRQSPLDNSSTSSRSWKKFHQDLAAAQRPMQLNLQVTELNWRLKCITWELEGLFERQRQPDKPGNSKRQRHGQSSQQLINSIRTTSKRIGKVTASRTGNSTEQNCNWIDWDRSNWVESIRWCYLLAFRCWLDLMFIRQQQSSIGIVPIFYLIKLTRR